MRFEQFPGFTQLKWSDRSQYEELIRDYPPIADISFAGLMGWWGLYKAPEISLLNGNIVIRYYNDDTSAELCIVGTNDIDQSCCLILDYLHEINSEAKLTHVPDFVIENMQHPELFDFKGERNYDEYIVSLSKFYPLEQSNFFHRRRVNHFIERVEGNRLHVGPIDLSQPECQKMLLDAIRDWPKKGVNYRTERQRAALENAILFADKLGLHNTCFLLDGVLHGFLLFQAPSDKKFITLEYMGLSYALPHLTNFVTFIFAEWFSRQGVEFVNICMDYGKPILRAAKLSLKPVNFFRKYTIMPQEEEVIHVQGKS